MKISIPHHTTRQSAKKRLDELAADLLKQFGQMASDVERHWEGDVMHFSLKAKGMKADGTMEVTDREVLIHGRLPLLAKPFEGTIKTAIEKEGLKIFRA